MLHLHQILRHLLGQYHLSYILCIYYHNSDKKSSTTSDLGSQAQTPASPKFTADKPPSGKKDTTKKGKDTYFTCITSTTYLYCFIGENTTTSKLQLYRTCISANFYLMTYIKSFQYMIDTDYNVTRIDC